MFVEILNCFCVKLDECLRFEFFSCFAKSCFGDNVLGDHCPRKDLPKLVQLRLVRAFYQVTEIQDKRGEWQFSIATEIWFLITVSFDKILGKDDFLNIFNNIGTSFGKQVLCQFA